MAKLKQTSSSNKVQGITPWDSLSQSEPEENLLRAGTELFGNSTTNDRITTKSNQDDSSPDSDGIHRGDDPVDTDGVDQTKDSPKAEVPRKEDKVKPPVKDPFSPEESDEVEDNSDPEAEESQENELDKTMAEKEQEQAEEGQLQVLFGIHKEYLNLPEDFEFDGSEESYAKAIELSNTRTSEDLKQSATAQLEAALPEQGKALLQYMLQGGTDLNSFTATYTDLFDYDNLNLEDGPTQKDVITEHYRLTTEFSEERIRKEVDRIEDTGELPEYATEAIKELKTIQQRQKETLLEEQRIANQAQKEKAAEAIQTLEDSIANSREIGGITLTSTHRKQLKSFLFDTVTLQTGTKTTHVQSKLTEYLHDPNKFLVLAAYLMNDFNLSSASSSAQERTKVGANLKRQLREAASKTLVSSRLGSVTKTQDPTQDINKLELLI